MFTIYFTVMTVTIVGVGLISGSFALALRDKGFAKHIIGVSRTEASAKKALELGIIDEALPLLEAIKKSDFIYVAIQFNSIQFNSIQFNSIQFNSI